MNNQTQTPENMRLVADSESITQVLASMEVGQSVAFPSSRYSSVRGIASSYGFQTGRRYPIRTNRAEKRIEVTRIA